jgi:undecaprenyl-diphosphatase
LGDALPSVFQAAMLGVVQGLTEFLPISSTAHLLIGQRLLGFDDPGSAFTEMIQLGSILAVMWLYRARVVEVVRGLPSSPDARRFALSVTAAFVPAMIVGALAADYVESVLHQSAGVIAAAFVVGGIVMLVVDRSGTRASVTSADRVPVARAFGIGVFQTLALIPGVSRSGATIVGGLLLGLDRRAAAEFSFFLAMPTMVGAFVYKLVDIRDSLVPGQAREIFVGFVMAFLAAAVVVKPFLNSASRSGFGPYAWYRIAAGLAMAGAIFAGWL